MNVKHFFVWTIVVKDLAELISDTTNVFFDILIKATQPVR